MRDSLLLTLSSTGIMPVQFGKKQVIRAKKALENGKVRAKKNANDFRRFIKTIHCTEDGEVAEKNTQGIDDEAIRREARFDGFLCRNNQSCRRRTR